MSTILLMKDYMNYRKSVESVQNVHVIYRLCT